MDSLVVILAKAPHPPTSMTDQHLNRLHKRMNVVADIRGTEIYELATTILTIDELPLEPDSHDIDAYSKRAWEEAIMHWRSALRDCEHCENVFPFSVALGLLL